MLIQGINNTATPLSYLNGAITISANSTVTIPNQYLNSAISDGSVVRDINIGVLSIGDGVTIYNGTNAYNILFNVSNIYSTSPRTSSGTINIVNGTVAISTENCSSVIASVTGTWTAQVFCQGYDGTNWIYINIQFVQFTAVTNGTAQNGSFIIACSGYSQVRLIAGAYTSGTISIQLSANNLQNISKLSDGSGNNITSSQQAGSTANKQLIDTANIAIAAGYYSAPVNIRQSATTAINSTVWAMRNPAASAKTIYIERIELLMAFDSAGPITRSLQRYDIERFTAATPTAGTIITPISMDSSASVTAVTDVRFLDTGLTTTSIVFGSPIVTIGCPATDATTTKYQRSNIAIKLAPGEGFCIRLNVAAAIGQSLTGEIIWSER